MAKIESRDDLEKWLNGRPPEVARIIAARAALRVLPLVVAGRRRQPGPEEMRAFVALTSAVFRCTALARAAGKYPARANDFAAYAAAYAARAADAADAAAAAADADATSDASPRAP